MINVIKFDLSCLLIEIRSNKDDEEERSELKRDLDKDEEENEGEKPRDEVEESGNLEGGFSSDYGLIKLEKSHFVSDNAVELELNKIERPLETGGLLGLGAVTVNKGSLWEGRVMPQSAGANREEMRVLEVKIPTIFSHGFPFVGFRKKMVCLSLQLNERQLFLTFRGWNKGCYEPVKRIGSVEIMENCIWRMISTRIV